jgi:hypothetical protein
MGTLFPKRFHRDCEPGDWNTWQVLFSEPGYPEPPVIFTSAADRFAETAAVYEHGDFSGWVPTNYSTPAVPVARKRTGSGFTLIARNPDPEDGATSTTSRPRMRPWRRSPTARQPAALGRFRAGAAAWFEPCSEVQSVEPLGSDLRPGLLTPPTVLVTAVHPSTSGPAVAGMACYVTPNGFCSGRATQTRAGKRA